MKYKGEEIGDTATIEQVKDCVETMGGLLTKIQLRKLYNELEKVNWMEERPWGSLYKPNYLHHIVSTHFRILYPNKEIDYRSKSVRDKLILSPEEDDVRPMPLEELKPNTLISKEMTSYQKELEDHRWKSFREFVLTVRGKECEVCGSKKGLQVHHLYYNANSHPWEYTCREVLVVCDSCHKKIHGIKE